MANRVLITEHGTKLLEKVPSRFGAANRVMSLAEFKAHFGKQAEIQDGRDHVMVTYKATGRTRRLEKIKLDGRRGVRFVAGKFSTAHIDRHHRDNLVIFVTC